MAAAPALVRTLVCASECMLSQLLLMFSRHIQAKVHHCSKRSGRKSDSLLTFVGNIFLHLNCMVSKIATDEQHWSHTIERVAFSSDNQPSARRQSTRGGAGRAGQPD